MRKKIKTALFLCFYIFMVLRPAGAFPEELRSLAPDVKEAHNNSHLTEFLNDFTLRATRKAAPSTLGSNTFAKREDNNRRRLINQRIYRIVPGDTLNKIARRFGVTLHELIAWNNIKNPDMIYAGQLLKIFKTTNLPARSLRRGSILRHLPCVRFPAQGFITSVFGMRNGRLHKGIDIGAPAKTPILAVMDGEVVYTGWRGGYGLMVDIKHQNGWISRYAHCSSICVKKGETVRRNQCVARVGNTGRSTGFHVHFELIEGERNLNPMQFIEEINQSG